MLTRCLVACALVSCSSAATSSLSAAASNLQVGAPFYSLTVGATLGSNLATGNFIKVTAGTGCFTSGKSPIATATTGLTGCTLTPVSSSATVLHWTVSSCTTFPVTGAFVMKITSQDATLANILGTWPGGTAAYSMSISTTADTTGTAITLTTVAAAPITAASAAPSVLYLFASGASPAAITLGGTTSGTGGLFAFATITYTATTADFVTGGSALACEFKVANVLSSICQATAATTSDKILVITMAEETVGACIVGVSKAFTVKVTLPTTAIGGSMTAQVSTVTKAGTLATSVDVGTPDATSYIVAGTASPTKAPTKAPTMAPTMAPTKVYSAGQALEPVYLLIAFAGVYMR